MTAVMIFVAGFLFIAYCGGVVAMMLWSFDGLDVSPLNGIARIAVAIALTVLPWAILVPLAMARDPNANRLCLSGHEEWVRVTRPPMLVGKMIVPGGASTEKRWFCEEWER